MSKSKIIVAVTIGIMSFMMVYIMLIQFNTAKEYDGEEIELMRETELKETLANYKEKYEEVNNELISTATKIEEYKKEEQTEEDAILLLEEEVNQANMLIGKTNVSGEGIIITMENINLEYEESILVAATDLIKLVNELKLAGAEAISINGQRIISTSSICDVGPFIYINGERTGAPYEIKAIGDRKYLQSALSIKGGYMDTYSEYNIKLNTYDNIKIGKYEGKITLDYIKEGGK